MPLTKLLNTLLLCGLGLSIGQAQDGWTLMSTLQFNEARQAFVRADQDEPRNRLGLGVALLGVQPKTERNLNQAEAIFSALREELPGTDMGVRATYFLARLAHLHRQPTDWEKAAEWYRLTYEADPSHEVAQRALVRWGLVTLLRANDGKAVLPLAEQFFVEVQAITDEEALRDADWVLLEFYERKLDDKAATLRHLEAMLASPVVQRDVLRAGFLIQAGELARLLGEKERAKGHYRAFLDLVRRDARMFQVRERLKELEEQS